MLRVRSLTPAALAAAALAVAAGPAHATTVSVNSSYGDLEIVAGAAERNNIDVKSVSASTIEITERGPNPLVVGSGCIRVPSSSVYPVARCTGVAGRVGVDLGDLNDRLTMNLPAGRVSIVFAGSGSDKVTSSGASADFLYAGDGADTMDGGAGDDRLDAVEADGAVDRLTGGAGSDRGGIRPEDTASSIELLQIV